MKMFKPIYLFNGERTGSKVFEAFKAKISNNKAPLSFSFDGLQSVFSNDLLSDLKINHRRPQSYSPPNGSLFLSGSFAGQTRELAYKLYVPSQYNGQPAPLIVMLHGCTQSADDFAAGTQMNGRAERYGCLVLYPEQARSANAQKCWNWFKPEDQRREGGEPSLIVGAIKDIMNLYSVDARRVYAAGLSAGGAAAAILGKRHPDIFAAVGVHSGLACGAASDIPSALSAMRQGASQKADRDSAYATPTIIFHGDHDKTVHPINGKQIADSANGFGDTRVVVTDGAVPGGKSFRRIQHVGASGKNVLEQWTIHGGGHAWSGGNNAGTYTDPQGPDASAEMLRFFLEHSR